MSAGLYRERDKLAEGGMAEIRAGEGADGRPVVIKRIRIHLLYDDDYRRLFADEGALSGRLEHRHIVPLIDRGEDDCGPYLVFEYVEGTDLAAVLDARCREGRPLTPAQAVAVALPLMKALAYAHTVCSDDGQCLCVVHRDISPGNVLLGDNGDVKLTDFGVAASSLRTDETVAGEMKGKFAYMAPEQTRGETVDSRADIFSAGTVLFEMLTGRRLFDAATDADVVHAVRSEAVPSIREHNAEVPDDLEQLVNEMLAKDPEHRPASAGDVVDRLESIAEVHCWDQGHKRHIKQLCREHPRQTLAAEDPDSGPKRRHTQRVLGADTGIQVVSDEPRRPLWPMAAVGGVVVIVAGAFFWPGPTQDAGPRPDKAGVEVGPVTAPDKVDPPSADKLAAKIAEKAAPGAGEEVVEKTRTAPAAAATLAKATPSSPRGPRGTDQAVSRKVKPVRVAKRAADRKPAPPPAQAAGFGEVYISSEPWAEVYVDGSKFGVTPVAGKKLAAGKHEVRLYSPHYKIERTFTITVVRNQKTQRFVELTK